MANPQHLEWLLEGVEAWNARREEEDFEPDFSGVDFRKEFEAADKLDKHHNIPLMGANFSEADLFKSDFHGANLEGAEFQGATLSHAMLQGASFIDTDFRNANLGHADFWDSDLQGADFRQADLLNADLSMAKLDGASFYNASMHGAKVRTLYAEAYDNQGSYPEYTNLSGVIGLTQEQLESMIGDRGTILPDGLEYPEDWPEPVDDSGGIFVKNELTNTATDAFAYNPSYLTAGHPHSNSHVTEARLLKITAPFDVEWTQDGQLRANLRAVNPRPMRNLPQSSESAQMHQMSTVGALAAQMKAEVRAATPPNAESILGDIGGVFEAIETEITKTDGPVLIAVVRARVRMLEALSIHKEVLPVVQQVGFDSFLEEAHRLLDLYPILREIDDPHHADLVPEEALDPALAAVDAFIEVMARPETEAAIGPSLPGVTRDLALYPWDIDRKKVAVLAAFGVRIKAALEDPPDWVKGTAQYATIIAAVTGIVGAIVAVKGP